MDELEIESIQEKIDELTTKKDDLLLEISKVESRLENLQEQLLSEKEDEEGVDEAEDVKE